MKRNEAWRVYGALLHAAGQCIYDLLKMFPPLTSLPARAVWRSNARVTTTVPSPYHVPSSLACHVLYAL
nr:isoform 6 of transcription initiation factor tfiid subunit 6b [Quercus suber]